MGATRTDQIYLGKNGQIFGPFSQAELNELQTSGRIQEYRWIWSMSHGQWEPLDPPPPPPVISEAATKETRRRPSQFDSKHILAMGHDFRSAVSGVLENVTEHGCELSSAEGHASPPFSAHGKIQLNLLNTSNGQSMNVEAKIAGIRREGSNWKYRLSWHECPEILQ